MNKKVWNFVLHSPLLNPLLALQQLTFAATLVEVHPIELPPLLRVSAPEFPLFQLLSAGPRLSQLAMGRSTFATSEFFQKDQPLYSESRLLNM